MKHSKFSVCDLFCGCGGLSLGLEEAGLLVKWACESDEDAAKTYAAAHPRSKVFAEDANITLQRCMQKERGAPHVGDVDLLVGGPPCQGFSGYNRYRSINDPRNSLLETYLAFVEVLRPRYLLLENVPGMLQMEKGKVAKLLVASLNSLGYDTRVGILQAGYYGLPQNRWRVFVLGCLQGNLLPTFPEPTHTFPPTPIFGIAQFKANVLRPNTPSNGLFPEFAPHLTVGDAISDLPSIENGGGNDRMAYRKLPRSDYQTRLRERSTAVLDHEAENHGPIMMERISAVPKRRGAGWLDLPEPLKPRNLLRHGDGRYSNRFGRLSWDGMFNTIVTRPYPYWGRFIHPTQDRVLSARECARAQSFPDRVQLFGKLSSKYRQIGNAVPPLLARAIGKQIMSAMGYNRE